LIISSLRINGSIHGLGILVSGTTKHLVIENCQISNTSSFAIDITGSSNVTIRDTFLSDDFCAFFLYSSDHCTIQDNTIASSKTGIQLLSSKHLTISSNIITDPTYMVSNS
jgi:parallel beta-helix repeat protein